MTSSYSGLHVTRWGSGPRVVMIHGGGPGGAFSFAAQEPLSERFELLLPDRPGHGQSHREGPDDFERDAEVLAPLLEGGAHLVGHSYGGIVALVMAVSFPDSVRSLALLEPPAYALAEEDPAVSAMIEATRRLLSELPADPRERMASFFEIVGNEQPLPDPLPPPLVAAAEELVGIRPPEEARIDPAQLAAGGYPVLVLTSGRRAGFEAVARALVERSGARHVVVPGTDHRVQLAGEPVNRLLEEHWAGN